MLQQSLRIVGLVAATLVALITLALLLALARDGAVGLANEATKTLELVALCLASLSSAVLLRHIWVGPIRALLLPTALSIPLFVATFAFNRSGIDAHARGLPLPAVAWGYPYLQAHTHPLPVILNFLSVFAIVYPLVLLLRVTRSRGEASPNPSLQRTTPW